MRRSAPAAALLLACSSPLSLDSRPPKECAELHEQIVALATDAGIKDRGVCLHGKLPRLGVLCGEMAVCNEGRDVW